MAKIINYECEQCGTEIVVTEANGAELRPIYCCGIEIVEISSSAKKHAPGKTAGKLVKKTVKKTVKKVAKTTEKKKVVAKKTVAAKRPAARKKSSK